MLYIIGMTASGKDYMANMLCERFGLKKLLSYTTRPRREGEGDTHIFISRDDLDKYPDKVATTEIDGNFYFSTRDQVLTSDIYIIDPNGLYELMRNMPDQQFTAIHIINDVGLARDPRRDKYIQRESSYGKDKESLKKDFDSRCKSERAQFIKFEDWYSDKAYNFQTGYGDFMRADMLLGRLHIYEILNTYDEKSVDKICTLYKYLSNIGF